MTHSPAIMANRRDAAIDFLHGRIDYERASAIPYDNLDFRLDRMRALLTLVGEPQSKFPIVHVAGTKGKGSTSAMIAAMLTAAGLRTGLYSSPHLDRLEERIAIDGQPCGGDELADLVERIRPAVATLDEQAARESSSAEGACADTPTYFEIVTALALMRFADAGVGAAVLEVGLGGRLDSTNVCQPAVAVITSISFDHMRQLGNTLAAIATEKAGIIKPGVPVVSGVVADEPRDAIEAIAAERGAPLIQLGRDFSFAYRPPRGLDAADTLGRCDFRSPASTTEPSLADLELGLLGKHQATNAAVALATVFELRRQGWRIPDAAIRAGLANVRWPARIEVVSRRPTVILDSAHNVASVAALAGVLRESFATRQQAPGRRLLIFATTRDKEIRGMLEVLLPEFDEVIFTRYLHNPRGVPAEELAATAEEIAAAKPADGSRRLARWRIAQDPRAAWRLALDWANDQSLVAITGSFFIAAEMRVAMHEGAGGRQ